MLTPQESVMGPGSVHALPGVAPYLLASTFFSPFSSLPLG
jgi:hypothetical protein